MKFVGVVLVKRKKCLQIVVNFAVTGRASNYSLACLAPAKCESNLEYSQYTLYCPHL